MGGGHVTGPWDPPTLRPFDPLTPGGVKGDQFGGRMGVSGCISWSLWR